MVYTQTESSWIRAHMFTSQCIESMYIAFSLLGLSGIVAPPFAGSNPFGITGGTTGQSYGGNIISPTKWCHHDVIMSPRVCQAREEKW